MEDKDLERSPTRPTVPLTKKSYLRQLSPWSGTKDDVNFFSIFARPFPMLAYPAVVLAILGCEFLTSGILLENSDSNLSLRCRIACRCHLFQQFLLFRVSSTTLQLLGWNHRTDQYSIYQ